jgi:hypothetical protein
MSEPDVEGAWRALKELQVFVEPCGPEPPRRVAEWCGGEFPPGLWTRLQGTGGGTLASSIGAICGDYEGEEGRFLAHLILPCIAALHGVAAAVLGPARAPDLQDTTVDEYDERPRFCLVRQGRKASAARWGLGGYKWRQGRLALSQCPFADRADSGRPELSFNPPGRPTTVVLRLEFAHDGEDRGSKIVVYFAPWQWSGPSGKKEFDLHLSDSPPEFREFLLAMRAALDAAEAAAGASNAESVTPAAEKVAASPNASDPIWLSRTELEQIVAALRTKGFVILAGISGTGKTQIARRVAGWLAARGEIPPEAVTNGHVENWIGLLPPPSDESRVAFVPVRPDWTDARKLWGWYNALTGLFYATPALRLVLAAIDDWHGHDGEARDHFLILDEMNLARVEYYLSDLLSLMEAPLARAGKERWAGEVAEVHPFFGAAVHMAGSADMHHGDERVKLVAVGPGWLGQLPRPDGGQGAAPHALGWPPNLKILGTVNVDETTFAFSPKVLDRAFVLEFTEVDFRLMSERVPDGLLAWATRLNRVLEAKGGFHFGYRTLAEMGRYCEHRGFDQDEVLSEGARSELLCSKILPRLRGTDEQVVSLFQALLADAELVPSGGKAWKKLMSMQARATQTGFTSFF